MDVPRIHFLGHATVLVEVDGLRLLTDPILRHRVTFLGRVAPRTDLTGLGPVDAVLISHLHHDHADVPSLRLLPRDTPVLAPIGSAAFFARLGFSDVHELGVGDQWRPQPTSLAGLRIGATRAVHHGHRVPFGPRAESIGFLIESGATSVYFAGDTDIFPGMADLHPQLDAALLPVWGWGPNLGPGHMDPHRAALALDLLRPRYAIPIHWGTLFPLGLRVLGGRVSAVLDQPPRVFQALATATRPECTVLLTQPGGVAELTL